MQRRNTEVFRITLIVAWALLVGYELAIWLAGNEFPPSAVMSLAHVGLATMTVVYAITRTSSSAEAQIELGRKIERANTGGGRGNVRSLDEVTR